MNAPRSISCLRARSPRRTCGPLAAGEHANGGGKVVAWAGGWRPIKDVDGVAVQVRALPRASWMTDRAHVPISAANERVSICGSAESWRSHSPTQSQCADNNKPRPRLSALPSPRRRRRAAKTALGIVRRARAPLERAAPLRGSRQIVSNQSRWMMIMTAPVRVFACRRRSFADSSRVVRATRNLPVLVVSINLNGELAAGRAKTICLLADTHRQSSRVAARASFQLLALVTRGRGRKSCSSLKCPPLMWPTSGESSCASSCARQRPTNGAQFARPSGRPLSYRADTWPPIAKDSDSRSAQTSLRRHQQHRGQITAALIDWHSCGVPSAGPVRSRAGANGPAPPA